MAVEPSTAGTYLRKGVSALASTSVELAKDADEARER